jgi:ribosomal protein S25
MKRSVPLLIAAIIGLIYVICIMSNLSNFAGAIASVLSAMGRGRIGRTETIVLLFPHIIFVLIAVIFNIIGWAVNKRGFAITAGILYSVSLIPCFILIIPSLVLSFVGAAQLKKKEDGNAQQNIVVNVAASASTPQNKVSAEKQILTLCQTSKVLTLVEIVSKTDLEMGEAEDVVNKLVAKGIAKEIKGTDGKTTYDFS